MRNRLLIAALLAFAFLCFAPGCVSVQDMQDTRDKIAAVHNEVAAAIASIEAQIALMPAGDARTQAETVVAGLRERVDGLGKALDKADAALEQVRSDQAGAIESGAGAVGALVGGPWGAVIGSLGVAGAAVWRLVKKDRAGKSIIASVQTLANRNPVVAHAISENAALLNKIQSPDARAMVDAVQRTMATT